MAMLFRVVFLGFIASFFIYGMNDMFTNYEENKCEMTYMYQLPEYAEIPLKKSISKEFPRYSLHLYGEGQYATESRSLKLTGIPVLFIPGNAGSHKQVRSLGSVALKMAQSRNANFHFNFFALNLNEELSGIFGGVVWKQTRFAHECIKHILTLYPDKKPRSVVIVGHSMGGMVARALFALPDFDPTLVTTIITQATPHQAPVISLDYEIGGFYKTVNEYWRQNVNTSLKYVSIFSTGGGYRDLIVRNPLVTMKGIAAEGRHHTTSTMSVPTGWVSTDHLCHVWCKQIVMATMRALFDMVDKNTKQFAQGPMYRLKVWQHHFETSTGSKNYRPVYDDVIKVNPKTKWELRQRPAWTFTRDKVTAERYSVVILPRDSGFSFVAVSNIDTFNWLGACVMKPKEENCSQLENFAQHSRLIPPSPGRKVVHVAANQLVGSKLHTHMVVILPKSRARVEVMAEVYNTTRRNLYYFIPHLFPWFNPNTTSPTTPEVVIRRTDPDAIFYNITIGNYGSLLDTYTAHLIVNACKDAPTGRGVGSIMRLHVPWSNEDTYSFIKLNENGNISLRLQTPRPAGMTPNAELHLYLHPACSYKVVVTRDWTSLLGQFVRHYWAYLPASILIQVFMGLSWQLKQIDEEGVAPSFAQAHARWAQPWRVVPVALMVRFLLTYPEDSSLADKLGLPTDDGTVLTARGVWLPALPIFLYLTAYAWVELYAYLLQVLLTVEATVFGFICKRCCMSLRVLRCCVVLQYLVLAGAAVLSVTVCGTLGLFVLVVVYLIKTCTHYIWARETESSIGEGAWNRFRVNSSLLLMFLLTCIFSAPSLIFWAKNLPFEPTLEVDPSRWSSFAICISALLLTYADIPATITDFYSLSSGLLYVSSVLMTIYAMESAYRLPFVVATNLLFLSAPIATLVFISGFRRPPIAPIDADDTAATEKKTK